MIKVNAIFVKIIYLYIKENEKEEIILKTYKAIFEKMYSGTKHPTENLTIIKLFMRNVEHAVFSYGSLKSKYSALTVFFSAVHNPHNGFNRG